MFQFSVSVQCAECASYNNQHLWLCVICQKILPGKIFSGDHAAAASVWPRCQAGCNIQQCALTVNGRTPATQATTKRIPLTAFPLFSASYMTPAPSWKKISVPSQWTRCLVPRERSKAPPAN